MMLKMASFVIVTTYALLFAEICLENLFICTFECFVGVLWWNLCFHMYYHSNSSVDINLRKTGTEFMVSINFQCEIC
jgi:hypothetical protein